jgi:hypothetical protein
MSDIASVNGALSAAVAGTGSTGAESAIAASMLTGTEALLAEEAATLMASLGVGQSVSTEA